MPTCRCTCATEPTRARPAPSYHSPSLLHTHTDTPHDMILSQATGEERADSIAHVHVLRCAAVAMHNTSVDREAACSRLPRRTPMGAHTLPCCPRSDGAIADSTLIYGPPKDATEQLGHATHPAPAPNFFSSHAQLLSASKGIAPPLPERTSITCCRGRRWPPGGRPPWRRCRAATTGRLPARPCCKRRALAAPSSGTSCR